MVIYYDNSRIKGDGICNMGRNDKCFCGSGRKRKKCHSSFAEGSSIEELYKLYMAIDEVQDTHEDLKNGPCRKGCSNCCYDVFSITMLEFELILQAIREKGHDYALNLFNTALENVKTMKVQSPEIMERLEEIVDDMDGYETLKDANLYGKQRRTPFPCPLLDMETGTCSVYEHRPFICRSFGTSHTELDKTIQIELCEYIPDSKEHNKYTPNIEDLQNSYGNIVKIEYNREKYELRKYPIFYWFKIYKDKNEKKGRNNYTSLVTAYFNKKAEHVQLQDVF